MNFIYKSKFWTKCPCEMEFKYMMKLKNHDHSCPIYGNSFIMEEYQGNTQTQSRLQVLKGELGHYKESNRKLTFELTRRNILMS